MKVVHLLDRRGSAYCSLVSTPKYATYVSDLDSVSCRSCLRNAIRRFQWNLRKVNEIVEECSRRIGDMSLDLGEG